VRLAVPALQHLISEGRDGLVVPRGRVAPRALVFFEDPEQTRPYFAALRNLRDTLLKEGVEPGVLRELSMGMSHDFEIAVQEGATIVRLGTAIFGRRQV